MKWEVYRRLTPMQQQEWTFRFSENTPPKVGFAYLAIIYVSLCLWVALMIIALKDYPDMKANFLVFFNYSNSIAYFMLWCCLIEYFIFLTIFIISKYKENKWVKEATKDFIFPEHKPALKRMKD